MLISLIIFGSLLIIGLAGFLFPRNILVKRSIPIQAKSEIIWEQISDLNNFKVWNPWSAKDPNIQIEITGIGIGSEYKWNGNRAVKKGSLTIINIVEGKMVEFELRFGSNPSPAKTALILENNSNDYLVTWEMKSDMGNNPAGRYMGLFMDKFVGKDFEMGLNNLRNVCLSR
ncbi:MAG: SRPBCC family protein [Crocinitomicaceae bacterium]